VQEVHASRFCKQDRLLLSGHCMSWYRGLKRERHRVLQSGGNSYCSMRAMRQLDRVFEAAEGDKNLHTVWGSWKEWCESA